MTIAPDMIASSNNLLQVSEVAHAFPKGDSGELLVLDNVNFTIKEGEIVSILGRSGSGKSTLLRIIGGLNQPTRGHITYRGMKVTEPPQGLSMVFQSFALFPWLTVLENVQIGMEAQRLPREEARKRAIDAIDLIGMDGFESAYPRELSGGMRQRVGIARALVVHPDLLVMDEPFSSLDILTAETLRTDLVELWQKGQLPVKGILFVTHNIEEAVLLSDRILLFTEIPGFVASEIKIDLPQPRDRLDPSYLDMVEQIYVDMTNRDGKAPKHSPVESLSTTCLSTILPRVSNTIITGLIEAVAAPPFNGGADLPEIASNLHMEIDDLFPVVETLHMMRLADMEGGDIKLTDAGMLFADSDIDGRKQLFAQHLMTYVPLAAHIRQVLDERESHTAPRSRFSDELEDHMSEKASDESLRAVTAWGRYAELFAYDDDTSQFSLEDPK